jgi:hypothetical protein
MSTYGTARGSRSGSALAGVRALRGAIVVALLASVLRGFAIDIGANEAGSAVAADAFLSQTRLNIPGLSTGDLAGLSVAISGDTVIVGSPGRDTPASGSFVARSDHGIAYVFVRTAAGWTQQATLIPASYSTLGGSGQSFGRSVALSGNVAVIGAPGEARGGNPGQGAVYVFERTGTSWSEPQRVPNPVTDYEGFGNHVGVAGGTFVATTHQTIFESGTPTSTRGQAVSFVRTAAGAWARETILPTPRAPGALSVRGPLMLVGSSEEIAQFTFEGIVDVYLRLASGWRKITTLRSPDSFASFTFGASLAVSGSRIAVGHTGGRGGAYLYLVNTTGDPNMRGSGTTTVTLEQAVGGTDATRPAGQSVGLNADTLILGSSGGDIGRALVFKLGPTGWSLLQELTPAQGRAVFLFGRSLDLDGRNLVVGAPMFAVGNTPAGTGGAFIFGDDEPLPGSGDPTTPGSQQPPQLSPASVVGSTVTLNWSAASGATSYRLQAGTAPGSSNAFDGNVGAATTLTATSVPNGSYFIRVRAVGSSAESGPSNEVRADVGQTSGCSPPTGPSNLRAAVNGQLVTLTWNGAPGATSYIVEAGSASGLANLAAVDVGPGTTLTANAPPGTYFVRVRMRNACGATAASNEITVTVG